MLRVAVDELIEVALRWRAGASTQGGGSIGEVARFGNISYFTSGFKQLYRHIFYDINYHDPAPSKKTTKSPDKLQDPNGHEGGSF